MSNEEAPPAVWSDLRIDHAAAGRARHIPFRPAIELTTQRQQHHVRLLGPDVVRDARLPKAQSLAAKRLLSGNVFFSDRLTRRREPLLLLARGEIDAPQISDEVAPLAEQVADECRIRRVVELARDRHPRTRETGNQGGRQLAAFGGFP